MERQQPNEFHHQTKRQSFQLKHILSQVSCPQPWSIGCHPTYKQVDCQEGLVAQVHSHKWLRHVHHRNSIRRSKHGITNLIPGCTIPMRNIALIKLAKATMLSSLDSDTATPKIALGNLSTLLTRSFPRWINVVQSPLRYIHFHYYPHWKIQRPTLSHHHSTKTEEQDFHHEVESDWLIDTMSSRDKETAMSKEFKTCVLWYQCY